MRGRVADPAPTYRRAARRSASNGAVLVDAQRQQLSDSAGQGNAESDARLDNDIVLDDSSVSRHHAAIESRNGRFQRARPGQPERDFCARRTDQRSSAQGMATQCGSATLRLPSVPDADFFDRPRFCSRCGLAGNCRRTRASARNAARRWMARAPTRARNQNASVDRIRPEHHSRTRPPLPGSARCAE